MDTKIRNAWKAFSSLLGLKGYDMTMGPASDGSSLFMCEVCSLLKAKITVLIDRHQDQKYIKRASPKT